MIFGDPYRFAIWVEHVPQWGTSYKNGLFYLIINGNLYPGDIRTATLSSDLYEILDNGCALISQPQDEQIFSLTTENAFKYLYNMAYPEPSEENEYPEKILTYCILSPNINEYGGCFFAIANEKSLRIVGGVVAHLVEDVNEGKNVWKDIDEPMLEDVLISKKELSEMMDSLKKYTSSILK